MRSRLNYLSAFSAWAAAAVALAACAEDDPPTRSFNDPLPLTVESASDYVLSFSDEFEGTVIDGSKWLLTDGDPKHKTTVNSASSKLVTQRDGSMFVGAMPTPEDPVFPYAAGYVDTRGRYAQTYGKIEFRARSQFAPGVWYALWGRAWANLVPEIDIEFLAGNTTQTWFVAHWDVLPLPADQRRAFTTVNGMDITDFHTYTVVWKRDLVEWRIDGHPFMRLTEPGRVPQEPMFWVMNAWVGGWGGMPTKGTIFPAQIEVDYIRIYRLREGGAPASVRLPDPRPRYTKEGAIDVEIADFEPGAVVEVWDGETRVDTLPKPPFRFTTDKLNPGPHTLRFVGNDGTRVASASADVTIR